jgi:hypothetical protein
MNLEFQILVEGTKLKLPVTNFGPCDIPNCFHNDCHTPEDMSESSCRLELPFNREGAIA